MPPNAPCTRRQFFARTGAGEELSATEFLPHGTTQATWLVLHGAGSASQERVEPLCLALASQGCASLSFDFSGHGLSSGSIAASSLCKKTDEAFAMTHYLDQKSPLSVCAFSMAGEIALRLLLLLNSRVRNLILFAPAIYDAAAFDITFGPGFSDIIRAKDSWQRSDAAILLRGFTGRILIVIGKKDDVIPPGVINILCTSASTAECVSVLHVTDAPHQLGLWMKSDPIIAEQMARRLVAFSDGTLSH